MEMSNFIIKVKRPSVLIVLIIMLSPLIGQTQVISDNQEVFRSPEGVELLTDIPYREGSQMWLVDIAIPTDAKGTLPTIVTVHGGGWRVGDKNGQRGLIIRMAQNGFVGVAIRYRLTDEAPFPACLEDVKCAVRWLRANAETYHVDPNRIGAMGHSAGAHLAAMLGLVPKEAGFDAGAYQEQSSMVNAVCAISTPTDFLDWKEEGGSPEDLRVCWRGRQIPGLIGQSKPHLSPMFLILRHPFYSFMGLMTPRCPSIRRCILRKP